MIAALVGLLLLQAADPLEGLRAEAREERERAIEELARSGAPCSELAGLLPRLDPRTAAGVAAALARRGDAAAIPLLLPSARGEDPEIGLAAARAILEIAMRTGAPLEVAREERLEERMCAAAREAVRGQLAERRGIPDYDAPGGLRPLLGGGRFAAAALEAEASDGGLPWMYRAHALVAAVRLSSEGSAGLCRALLRDAEPKVRSWAAEMLLRVGDEADRQALADLLVTRAGRDGDLTLAALAAVQQGAAASPAAIGEMERLVLGGPLELALEASTALQRVGPGPCRSATRARVLDLLASEERRAGAGVSAVLFDARVGPLDADLRLRMRGSATDLLHLAGIADRAEALAAMRPFLDPEKPLDLHEHMRARVLRALLLRHDAPWEDRLAFARGCLRSESPSIRATGARMLAGAPREVIGRVAEDLDRARGDASESVRLAVAALSPAEAVPALLQVVFDGDPRATREAAALLALAKPEWPRIDPAAPVAERRQAVWELSSGRR